jgi:N-[(2S)-2-amino-2-carboxyethyl]-L-glutamate dehydrogenase
MGNRDLTVVTGEQVRALLVGREPEVVAAVLGAYRAHAKGESSLPHSAFVVCPEPASRIVALPGFLGDGFGVAGVKWIASFPGNRERGLSRASAVLVLNSCQSGRPEFILEATQISAARTAASAAAAARLLLSGKSPERVGLLGAGPINREIARYLLVCLRGIESFLLYDLDPRHAAEAAETLRELGAGIDVAQAEDAAQVLRRCPLVSFATTATSPHIDDLAGCPRGATFLHISLRDLAPEAVLACDNIVDDPEHVCRAQTSLHLAEQLTGSRSFIRCTLAEILEGTAPARSGHHEVSVFSPFGLGVLDLAVGKMVRDLALAEGSFMTIPSFLPAEA